MGDTLTDKSIIVCKRFSKCHQILATVSATLGSFALGMVLGWTSPALPDLKQTLDIGELSANDVTWIASLAILGALVSGPPTSLLINKIGRRSTMILMSIPFTIGWVLIASAIKVPMLIYLGRFITGFSGGTFTVTVPVYVSEIADESLRGVLGSVMVLMLVTGILFAFVLGWLMSWLWLSITCGCFPILIFIMMFFMPETPRYLLMRGRESDAKAAFKWLRGSNDWSLIEQDFLQITEGIRTTTERSNNWRKAFSSFIIKPALICIALMCFQQLGGINAVTMYTVDIFISAGPQLQIDPNIASIIIGIVQVIFVLFSMLMVERLGRRLLLVGSCLLMSASLFVLGLFFYYKEQNMGVPPSSMTWVPMVTLVTFIIAYSFGMGPIPWLLISELLSPHFKGEISAFVTVIYWTLAFFATKTFQDIIALTNESGCYWIFGLICLGGALFSYFIVPETKGKSLEEIQRYFGDNCDKERYEEGLEADGNSQYSSFLERDSNRNETKKVFHQSPVFED